LCYNVYTLEQGSNNAAINPAGQAMTRTSKPLDTSEINPTFHVIGDAGCRSEVILFSHASIKKAVSAYEEQTVDGELGAFSMIEVGYFDDEVWVSLVQTFED